MTTDERARRRVTRCLGGEPGAWEEFVAAYGDLVYATLLRRNLTDSELEDTFQDVWVIVYQQLGALRDPAKVASWLIGISNRRAIDVVRKNVRHRRIEGELDPPPPPVLSEAEGELERLEDSHRLHELLDQLSERCRRIVKYLFFDDPPRTYDEVAELESIPRGSIGPTRNRCLAGLREAWIRDTS